MRRLRAGEGLFTRVCHCGHRQNRAKKFHPKKMPPEKITGGMFLPKTW
jgi:hypothetical protein